MTTITESCKLEHNYDADDTYSDYATDETLVTGTLNKIATSEAAKSGIECAKKGCEYTGGRCVQKGTSTPC